MSFLVLFTVVVLLVFFSELVVQGLFRGKLGTMVDGIYDLVVLLYDVDVVGNFFWKNSFLDVFVEKGVFNLILGVMDVVFLGIE